MGSKVWKTESLLRLLCLVLAAMTALLVGLDAQTKEVLFVRRKATVKSMQALWVLTVIASVSAGYHLLHLCRLLVFSLLAANPHQGDRFVAWACFLLDQGITYATFAGTTAALQGSLVALIGVRPLQWSKLCNVYTRFCFEIGGGLTCGFAASFTMAIATSISASHLFRLYPSGQHSSIPTGGSG